LILKTSTNNVVSHHKSEEFRQGVYKCDINAPPDVFVMLPGDFEHTICTMNEVPVLDGHMHVEGQQAQCGLTMDFCSKFYAVRVIHVRKLSQPYVTKWAEGLRTYALCLKESQLARTLTTPPRPLAGGGCGGGGGGWRRFLFKRLSDCPRSNLLARIRTYTHCSGENTYIHTLLYAMVHNLYSA